MHCHLQNHTRQVYCNYFREISTLACDIMSGYTLVTMKELIPCLEPGRDWKPNEGELTPTDIMNMLELWVTEKVKVNT